MCGLDCVRGLDVEGLYDEPLCGGGAGGAAVAAAGAGGTAVGGAGGADGVAAGVAAVGAAAGAAGTAGDVPGTVSGADTVPVASVALGGSNCDELTSANRCCSLIGKKKHNTTTGEL